MTYGLKSQYTKIAYGNAFNHFLDLTIKSQDRRALLNTKQSVIESKIIDHIEYLRNKKDYHIAVYWFMYLQSFISSNGMIMISDVRKSIVLFQRMNQTSIRGIGLIP